MVQGRVTINDVHAAFSAYQRQLATMGYDASELTLTRDSTAAGWRVVKRDGNGAPAIRLNGQLGFTSREAYNTLRTVTDGMKFATTWSVENFERVNR